MNWYIKAFKKYATFQGRAQRAEYWYFILFYTLGIFLFALIDGIFGSFSDSASIGIFSGLFMIINIIPTIAVSVRRLHDINRSGWWYLITFIPVIGPIIFFFFAIIDSKEDNQYGKNPKATI
jgi:uncharacterized membrane protein YhaH (DUF805 family)